MSEPEAAQAVEPVQAHEMSQTGAQQPEQVKAESVEAGTAPDKAQTQPASEAAPHANSEAKSAEQQANEPQIATNEQKKPEKMAEPQPAAPIEPQSTETAAPSKAPAQEKETRPPAESQPIEASEPHTDPTTQLKHKEPQTEAKGDVEAKTEVKQEANVEAMAEAIVEADEAKGDGEPKVNGPKAGEAEAVEAEAAETAEAVPTEKAPEATEKEAADADASMCEAEADAEEPPQKKLKIDSSQVLASVEHFADFVSGVVVYREHEEPLANLNEDHLNSTVWVRVARRYVTRNNPNVLRRKLWGTDVYTDDSDIVAALYHCNLVEDGESDLMVSLKLLPRLLKYQGCFLNDLNSRSWDRHHDGISYKIVDVKPLPRGSAEYPASERLARVQQWEKEYAQQKSVRASLNF